MGLNLGEERQGGDPSVAASAAPGAPVAGVTVKGLEGRTWGASLTHLEEAAAGGSSCPLPKFKPRQLGNPVRDTYHRRAPPRDSTTRSWEGRWD